MKTIQVIALLLVFHIGIAQEVPIPTNIQQAYKNQTRSKDGIPGPNYWQNQSNYKINATVDTDTESISGNEVITYFNNSPDTLKNIVIRVYQDFFRKGNARQWPANEGDLTEGVQITKLIIDGKVYDTDKDFPWWWITNLNIRLKDKILPHSKTEIEIDWEVKIPTQRGLRMRKYADGHYFIAYWYPQIAVYDDVDGWDQVEYTGLVEFYNDLNNFEVNLTVPANYLLRSTGDPENLDEILQKDIVNRYKEALKSDEVINIITQKDYNKNDVFKTGETHTWKIKAENVPDFSFAMSTHSNWDGSSLVVDSSTMRRVLADVLYPDGTKHWDQAASISRKSIEYMSFQLPGFAFPYPHMTSFCAGSSGGGMETPMMANDGAPKDFESFAELLFHEISHSYFPFFMGTNERKYAWMDEGWAAFLPGGFAKTLDPESNYLEKEIKGFINFAGSESALPLMSLSYQHNDFSSARIASYNQPATAYHVLKLILGDELFKKALLEYMNRWNGKHPLPHDFFNTFNEVSGQDLSWFWQPWFYQSGYPDLGIKAVNGNKVTIAKYGNYPVPIELHYKTANGETAVESHPANIWKAGKTEFEITLPKDTVIELLELGNPEIPDKDLSNNYWRN